MIVKVTFKSWLYHKKNQNRKLDKRIAHINIHARDEKHAEDIFRAWSKFNTAIRDSKGVYHCCAVHGKVAFKSAEKVD